MRIKKVMFNLDTCRPFNRDSRRMSIFIILLDTLRKLSIHTIYLTYEYSLINEIYKN